MWLPASKSCTNPGRGSRLNVTSELFVLQQLPPRANAARRRMAESCKAVSPGIERDEVREAGCIRAADGRHQNGRGVDRQGERGRQAKPHRAVPARPAAGLYPQPGRLRGLAPRTARCQSRQVRPQSRWVLWADATNGEMAKQEHCRGDEVSGAAFYHLIRSARPSPD